MKARAALWRSGRGGGGKRGERRIGKSTRLFAASDARAQRAKYCVIFAVCGAEALAACAAIPSCIRAARCLVCSRSEKVLSEIFSPFGSNRQALLPRRREALFGSRSPLPRTPPGSPRLQGCTLLVAINPKASATLQRLAITRPLVVALLPLLAVAVAASRSHGASVANRADRRRKSGDEGFYH